MNFKEILHQTTPFLILCPLLILFAIVYAAMIWKEGGTSIMLLPQVLILLFLSVLLLVLDRLFVKNWQQTLVIIELLSVLFIYLGIAYKGRVLQLQPEEKVKTFTIVFPVEVSKANDLEYVFPFSRKMSVSKNGQVLFLSEQMEKAFRREIKPSFDIQYSVKEDTILGKIYTVEFYRLIKEKSDVIEPIEESEKVAILKEIEEVLRN